MYKPIPPLCYNSDLIDYDYEYVFGINFRHSPDYLWKYKGIVNYADNAFYDEYEIDIDISESTENNPLIYQRCIAQVSRTDPSKKIFIFKGCELKKENIRKIYHVLECNYSQNFRIDRNYTRLLHSKEIGGIEYILDLSKKLVNGVKYTLMTSPRQADIEIKFSYSIPNQNDIKFVKNQYPPIKKVMIFDTETSGKHSGYNVILQLSYQIIDINTWNVEKSKNYYFQWPDDEYKIDWDAIWVNHLTWEYLQKQKLTERKDALMEFLQDLSECQLSVAHNLDFDRFFIEDTKKEYLGNRKIQWPFCVDTMKDTTELCRLSPRRDDGEWKWPTLQELSRILKIDFQDLTLHDSRSDVELTKRCFESLYKRGFYKFRV